MSERLTAEYLAEAERDARRFSGAYTGTSGTLAAHVIRLVKEVRRMAENGTACVGADAEPATIPVDWILRGERELKAAKERPEPTPLRLRGDSLLQADDDPPAARLLMDAAAAVRQRRATYGPPGAHFAMTVALINARYGTSFKPEDWATIMQLDKIARSAGPGYTPDNDVDGAGYAACRHEIMSERP